MRFYPVTFHNRKALRVEVYGSKQGWSLTTYPIHALQKTTTAFLSYFKTLCIDPAPGIEPATSRSAVERSTD